LTTTKKKIQKRKPEYVEGAQARKKFEWTMTALFQVPEADSKKARKGKD